MIERLLEHLIDKLIEYIIPFIFGSGTLALVSLIIFLVYRSPEKLEQWLSMIWKFIYFIFKKGQKKIISFDIQGRINEFAITLKKEFPTFNPVGINIQWIGENEKASDFFKDNKLIIRLKHHHDQDKNFVKASMIFISRVLLSKTKKYLSPSQKQSIDLYVAKRLFEIEKPRVVDHFFNNYYSDATFNSDKIANLLEKYHIIDKVKLFFPVLIQELTFLGEKIFFMPRNQEIIIEVTDFINYLEKHSLRNVGDEKNKNYFEGSYLRCGIIIIAKGIKRKIGDINPYINFTKSLLDKNIENIYLIGSSFSENKTFMDNIRDEIISKYGLEKYSEKEYRANIKIKEERIEVDSYLIHLRSKNAIRYYDKEYQNKYFKKVKEDA